MRGTCLLMPIARACYLCPSQGDLCPKRARAGAWCQGLGLGWDVNSSALKPETSDQRSPFASLPCGDSSFWLLPATAGTRCPQSAATHWKPPRPECRAQGQKPRLSDSGPWSLPSTESEAKKADEPVTLC